MNSAVLQPRPPFRPLSSRPGEIRETQNDSPSDAVISTPAVWSDLFRVRSYEVGPDYRATVQTLVDYFQEAAGNHTHISGLDGGLNSGWSWVMLRFRLRVHRLPAWRSQISAQTWACGFQGIRAERAFRFLDTDGRLLAEGTSYWVTIDLNRRRPMRPPSDVARFPVPDLNAPTFEERKAPEPPETVEREVLFTVRHSDLDVNQHVNNVCFLDWALEAIPSAYRNAHSLAEVDLSFKAESVFGDMIVSSVSPDTGGHRTHRLARRADGKDLAWARTRWIPKN
ncbi:MAG: thioesterase [Rubricoccaceae bacterium]|nr:thioesterase [Rubricoccaceae bacterium]